MSGGNFWGGRKPFPKPSAFESEIHPTHKPSVYAPGYFALAGSFGSTLSVLPISMRPKGRDEWMVLLFTASFRGKYVAAPVGLHRSPLWLSESDSRELPRYGHVFAISRPMSAAHKETMADYLIEEVERHL